LLVRRIFAIRLKIEHRRISESETIVTSDRIAGQHFAPATAASFAPELQQDVPVAARETRNQLLAEARIAWGIDTGNLPTTPTCRHFENGESPDGGFACRAGGSGRVTRNFRIPLVDVAKGVVIGFKLEDTPDPEPRTPPPGRAPERTPVFYYTPLTFNVMQIAKSRITSSRLMDSI